jgi:hypothetical protein
MGAKITKTGVTNDKISGRGGLPFCFVTSKKHSFTTLYLRSLYRKSLFTAKGYNGKIYDDVKDYVEVLPQSDFSESGKNTAIRKFVEFGN